MGSGSWGPAVSGDDGFIFGTAFNNTVNHLDFGQTSTNSRSLFVRYPGVGIPKGAVITSAYVRYRASVYRPNSGMIILTNMYFNVVDNAVAPTTYAQYIALALTSVIPWDFAAEWNQYGYYNTIDISSILQEVINRDGWVPGNAVMFLHKNDGSASNRYRVVYSYDSSDYAPRLFAEWSLPGGEITRRNLLFRPRQGDNYGSRR